MVQALDEEFFDYNKETRAREGYYNLRMQNSETYRCFRMKFRELAMEAGTSRACWFNDLCNKITPALRRDIKGEKFRMSEDYTRLDEFLQYLDRENAAIILDTRARPNTRSSANHGENHFQVLTKASSPE